MVWRGGSWTCVREDSRPLPASESSPPYHGGIKRTDSECDSLRGQVVDPLSHPALAETVRYLLADIKSQPVFASISSNEVLLKWIQMSDAVPQATVELQKVAIETALENENHIPIALNSAAYDFQLLSPTTLLVGWMLKRKLVSVLAQLSGVELAYLAPQSVVLANQLLSHWDGSERVCGVHIDGQLCDLVVVEAGLTDRPEREAQICFGRSFVIENADQLWRTVRHSLANCPNPTGTPLKRIVLLHAAESSKGSASGHAPVNSESSASNAGYWSLATGTASQLGVAEVAESTFDWHTALLKPIQRPISSDRWSAKSSFTGNRLLTAGSGFILNLLSPVLAERAVKRKLRRKRLLMRMIPIAALLLLLGANVKLFDTIESKSERIDTLRRARAHEKTLQTETKSLQERHTEIEDALAHLAWGERRFPTLAERLVQISNRCPATVRLTEIRTVLPSQATKADVTFDARRALLVIGVAPAQSEINAFRAALVTQPEFSSVRQVETEQTLIGGKRWLEFTLALTSLEAVE